MLAFAVRRTASAVLAFLGATAVVFAVTFALPGDPARLFAGGRRATPATLAGVRAKYGLDDPLPEQYLGWLGRLVRGDLGPSIATRRPVATMMAEALPVTLRLIAVTLLIEVVLGLAWGTWAAARAGRLPDHLLVGASTLAIAAPVFVVASASQYVVGVQWDLLPVAGTGDGLRGYVLPAGSLAISGFALFARLVRTEVGGNAGANHVRTARGKGLPERTVQVHHVLRCGLVPLLAFVGLELGALLGGSVVVERTFDLPGLGGLLAQAVAQRDQNVIVGCTVLFVAVYLVIDVVVDLAGLAVDPRLRSSS